MTTTHAEPPRLRILEALRDGWQAFCRAPWPFVLFTLLTGSLNPGCPTHLKRENQATGSWRV